MQRRKAYGDFKTTEFYTETSKAMVRAGCGQVMPLLRRVCTRAMCWRLTMTCATSTRDLAKDSPLNPYRKKRKKVPMGIVRIKPDSILSNKHHFGFFAVQSEEFNVSAIVASETSEMIRKLGRNSSNSTSNSARNSTGRLGRSSSSSASLMAGEQALQYVPVVRIFRRACGYEAFFAAYPLSATGGRRLKNAQVVTCPMLVHEQIALTLFSLTTYEQMPRATAIAEVQEFCPGLPTDYELVGVQPWSSPFRQPHTYIAWITNLTIFVLLLLLIFIYIQNLGDTLDVPMFWGIWWTAQVTDPFFKDVLSVATTFAIAFLAFVILYALSTLSREGKVTSQKLTWRTQKRRLQAVKALRRVPSKIGTGLKRSKSELVKDVAIVAAKIKAVQTSKKKMQEVEVSAISPSTAMVVSHEREVAAASVADETAVALRTTAPATRPADADIVEVVTPLSPVDAAALELLPPLPGLDEGGSRIGLRLEALDEAGGLVVVRACLRILLASSGADEVGNPHTIGIAESIELLEAVEALQTDSTRRIDAMTSREREASAAPIDEEESSLAHDLEAFARAHPTVDLAFSRVDVNQDGEASRAEVIKAARMDAEVRKLLGLPAMIRQEDGSRDAFEEVFQKFDLDSSKAISRHEWLRTLAVHMGWLRREPEHAREGGEKAHDSTRRLLVNERRLFTLATPALAPEIAVAPAMAMTMVTQPSAHAPAADDSARSSLNLSPSERQAKGIKWAERMLADAAKLSQVTKAGFAAADVDGSGALDMAEAHACVAKVAGKFHMPVPREEKTNELFAKCVGSGSDQMQLEQFAKYFRIVLSSVVKKSKAAAEPVNPTPTVAPASSAQPYFDVSVELEDEDIPDLAIGVSVGLGIGVMPSRSPEVRERKSANLARASRESAGKARPGAIPTANQRGAEEGVGARPGVISATSRPLPTVPEKGPSVPPLALDTRWSSQISEDDRVPSLRPSSNRPLWRRKESHRNRRLSVQGVAQANNTIPETVKRYASFDGTCSPDEDEFVPFRPSFASMEESDSFDAWSSRSSDAFKPGRRKMGWKRYQGTLQTQRADQAEQLAAIHVQAAARGRAARRMLRRQEEAAIDVQRNVRGLIARRKLAELRAAEMPGATSNRAPPTKSPQKTALQWLEDQMSLGSVPHASATRLPQMPSFSSSTTIGSSPIGSIPFASGTRLPQAPSYSMFGSEQPSAQLRSIPLASIPRASGTCLPQMPSFSSDGGDETEVIAPALEHLRTSQSQGGGAGRKDLLTMIQEAAELAATPSSWGRMRDLVPTLAATPSEPIEPLGLDVACVRLPLTAVSSDDPPRATTRGRLTLPPTIEESPSTLARASLDDADTDAAILADELIAKRISTAAIKIQAATRGSVARKKVTAVRTEAEEELRQQVLRGVATLPEESIRCVRKLIEWAESAAPALALSVRAQRQHLRRHGERRSMGHAEGGKGLVSRAAKAIADRPPDLKERAHAWVERQVTLGLLAGKGSKQARELLLAVRQVKLDGLDLPSPRTRGRARQEAAIGSPAHGSPNAELHKHARAAFNEMEKVGLAAIRNVFGASGAIPRSAHASLSQEDTLALCTRVLNALLDVGMLHETNEWLTEQLAWRGVGPGGSPSHRPLGRQRSKSASPEAAASVRAGKTKEDSSREKLTKSLPVPAQADADEARSRESAMARAASLRV